MDAEQRAVPRERARARPRARCARARPFCSSTATRTPASDEAAAGGARSRRSPTSFRRTTLREWTRRTGPIVANRRMRAAFRRAVAQYVEIGIPVTNRAHARVPERPGTRRGLRPREAWYEVIKWQALAAREIASRDEVATVWSWGWGTVQRGWTRSRQGRRRAYLPLGPQLAALQRPRPGSGRASTRTAAKDNCGFLRPRCASSEEQGSGWSR